MATSHATCHDGTVPTVLIVDDHPTFRATARTLLQEEGYDVVGEAADGTSAIEAVRRLHPEVVLLDVALPDMDGFEVCSRLKANGSAPAIVLTSSRDWAQLPRLIVDCGACGFLPKGELSGEAISALIG